MQIVCAQYHGGFSMYNTQFVLDNSVFAWFVLHTNRRVTNMAIAPETVAKHSKKKISPLICKIFPKTHQKFRNDFSANYLICSGQNKRIRSSVFTMRAKQQCHSQQCTRARTSNIKGESKSGYILPHSPPNCWV